jgi:hypothetical protein
MVDDDDDDDVLFFVLFAVLRVDDGSEQICFHPDIGRGLPVAPYMHVVCMCAALAYRLFSQQQMVLIGPAVHPTVRICLHYIIKAAALPCPTWCICGMK